jgi:AAA domain
MHAIRPHRAPRIGITGSAGTGKTTLAEAVAAALGIPLQGEPMRERLVAGLDLHRLSRSERRAMLRCDAAALARWLACLGPDEGAVSDRTPLDMLAFWLGDGHAVEAPDLTMALTFETVCAMADYDRVIVLPWGAAPIEADGVRWPEPWMQWPFQLLIEGLCRHFLPEQRLCFIPQSVPFAERLAWALRGL